MFYFDSDANRFDGLLVKLPATGIAGVHVHDVNRQDLSNS